MVGSHVIPHVAVGCPQAVKKDAIDSGLPPPVDFTGVTKPPTSDIEGVGPITAAPDGPVQRADWDGVEVACQNDRSTNLIRDEPGIAGSGPAKRHVVLGISRAACARQDPDTQTSRQNGAMEGAATQ